MMNKDLVSVILPVYGVEKYLADCIESILNQTYKNLQIILVDDESKDRSPEICDDYAKKDPRIKVIHKKNGGAASARNVGLDNAAGDYVCFVDSDDTVKTDYIEKLLYTVNKYQADVAVCGFFYYYQNRLKRAGYQGQQKEFTQKEYLKKFLSDWMCGLIWNKIFSKAAIQDIRFEEGHKIDDEFFTYQVIMNAHKVIQFEEPLYNYRMRKSSVMSEASEYQLQILQDKLQYTQKRYEQVVEMYPELKKVYLEGMVDSLIHFCTKGSDCKEGRDEIRNVIHKYQRKILLSNINWKVKYQFLRGCFSVKKGDLEKESRQIDETFFE